MSVGLTYPDLPKSWAKRHPALFAASIGAAVLCCGLAFWAGTKQARGLSSEVYAQQRMPLINAKLDEARKGFIFLAGDSHAELFNSSYRLCGREIVNGGISGAKAELYRELAPKLEFVARPDAVILTIGTNNLLQKKEPLSSEAMGEFEENVTRIVSSFRKVSRRIVVTAIPPISPSLDDGFEIPAVAAYSDRLRNLCSREGCEFVDPYDAIREPDGSNAQPGTMRDGLHLNSYRDVQARLDTLLCPGGSS